MHLCGRQIAHNSGPFRRGPRLCHTIRRDIKAGYRTAAVKLRSHHLWGTVQAVRRINLLRKKLCFVNLGVLLGALLVSMNAEGGVNSWTNIGPEGGSIVALAIDPITPS